MRPDTATQEDLAPLVLELARALRARHVHPSGHPVVADSIRRAAAIFDRVVVGVVRDPTHKETLFSVEERVAFLEPDAQAFRF